MLRHLLHHPLGGAVIVATALVAGSAGRAAESFLEKSDLFEAGRDGYALYRIPGIIVTAKGTVLAYCEARRTGKSDWDTIDILLRRSTDGGKTWSPRQKIADVPGPKTKNPVALAQKLANPDDVTYNNAVAFADRDGSVHVLFCLEYARCFYLRSDDDGQTFSSPVEITAAFDKFRPEYDWKVLATGPAHGIQLRSGRLVVPVWLSTGTGGHAHRPSVTTTIFSDDRGKTWQRGDIAVPNTDEWVFPNETVLVELVDGRVMLNVRSESKVHRRIVVTSPDGATNWSKPLFDEALLEPICMASLMRFSAKPIGNKNRILFANPHNLERADGKGKEGVGRDRKNLSIKLSYDEGQTWPVNKSLEPGYSAYSDLAVLPDGTILCLYERGREADAERKKPTSYAYLTLARFNLEWLTEGRDSSADAAKRRHERVAERRQGVEILCHRGALEFAQENTLEAYRATLELGGDGNEIDIRQTRDGVLVCFHDDMLDRLLEAYGTVPEVTWPELQSFPFRDPGPFGEQCRVPTLTEVLELHRRHAGLLHLDIKEPGLDRPIAEMLDQFDMWDHVAFCNGDNGAAIIANPRVRLDRYKAGLYLNRGEVDPTAIAAALERPGNAVIVEDPRGVLFALGRKVGAVSKEPVAPVLKRSPSNKPLPPVSELIATLRDADDWNRVAESVEDKARAGERIRARARAAEQLLAARVTSQEALGALEERVRHRSLHKEWMYHGFDGAMALRTLILLRAPNAVEVARFALWLDDPALAPVVNPQWNNPRSWTDFRVKMLVFPALEMLPGPATEQLCRDYLALSDDEVRAIGPPQFEAAAKTLLTISPTTPTALELMKHRLSEVRGRAILECVRQAGAPWARTALEQAAPYALHYSATDQ